MINIKKQLICITIVVISHQLAQAQFTANTRRGCAPLTVTLTENTGGGINIIYNFLGNSDQAAATPASTFTYVQPGKYTIYQHYSFMGSGKTVVETNYIEVLPSPPPLFTIEACENNEAIITITDNQYEQYFIDFENNGTYDLTVLKGAAPAKHIYPASQIYSVRVKGDYVPGSCGGDAVKTVQTYQNLVKPTITQLKSVDNNTLVLSFSTLLPYEKYKLVQKINNGSYTTIGPINTPTYTIQNINTATSSYYYKLVAYNECGTELASDEVSSIVLDATAADNKNVIGWINTSLPNFQKYEIYKNGNLIYTSTIATTNVIEDANISCNKNYCYQLIAYFTTSTSISNTDCVKGIIKNTPPAIEDITIYPINENKLAIQFDLLPQHKAIQDYELVYSSGSSITHFQQPNQELNISYKNGSCYTIRYTDSCSNVSMTSSDVCPIEIKGEQVNAYQNNISWTTYTGWKNGVKEYIVEKIDDNQTIYSEENMKKNTSFSDQLTTDQPQVLHYRIKALSTHTTPKIAYSLTLELRREMEIYLPDAFSPNNDGKNDALLIKGKFIKKIKLTLFNNWGQPIFESTSLTDSWDGKIANSPAPIGAYTYLIEAEDFTKKKIIKNGTILIIR